MSLKWKSQHFLRFHFPLSLVSIIGIKKFHISTSTSAIILKIQIKNTFFAFLFSLTFLATKQSNKYKEMSFHAQNFPGISKAIKPSNGVWDIMWVETQIQKLYYLCLVAFSTPALKLDKSKKMASIVPHSVADDKDLDDADLWAIIDSAVASHSTSKSRKSLIIRSPNFQSLSPISNPSPPSKLSKYPKTPNSNHSDTKSRVSTQGKVI